MGLNLYRLDGLKFHSGKPGSCNDHLRLLAQTCVARSLTSANPGLVLLKLKYFIFWCALPSFLSCVLHVYRKKGLFIANLYVNSCSLIDPSNYSIISFCHKNLYLHRFKCKVQSFWYQREESSRQNTCSHEENSSYIVKLPQRYGYPLNVHWRKFLLTD